MNVFEKELINAFFSPFERDYNKAIEIMFYGKNRIATACRTVVNKCFQGKQYLEFKDKDLKKDTLYNTFVSLFWPALRNKEDKVREVKNLTNWMFTAVKNFCNQYRNQIDYLLGLNPYGNNVPFDQQYDIDDGEEDNINEETPEEDVVKDEAEDQSSDSDSTSDVIIDIPDETDQPFDSDPIDCADYRLNRYLETLLSSGRNNARYYHDLIVDIHILGKTKKEVAAAFGRTPKGIDKDLQNAREALVADNIEAIRKKGKNLFNIYGTLLASTHYQVLDDFYSDKRVSPNKAAKAWRALITIAVRDEKERIKIAKKEDCKIEKKEKKIEKYGL